MKHPNFSRPQKFDVSMILKPSTYFAVSRTKFPVKNRQSNFNKRTNHKNLLSQILPLFIVWLSSNFVPLIYCNLKFLFEGHSKITRSLKEREESRILLPTTVLRRQNLQISTQGGEGFQKSIFLLHVIFNWPNGCFQVINFRKLKLSSLKLTINVGNLGIDQQGKTKKHRNLTITIINVRN